MSDTSVVFNILAKDKASDVMGKVGGAAKAMFSAFAVGAAVAGIKDAISAASDLAETQSKVNVLFGSQSGALNAWAAKADKALGQSKQQALDAAATFGVFAKSAGLGGEKAVEFSTSMTGLASDMASFSNTTPEQAIEAIGAALRGESEPIRAYGVLLDDASMRQEALSMGLIQTTTQALTPQQKVLAAQALIVKQTSAAHGDFARTSDGLANQQRILTAEFENAKAKIGTELLPVVLQLTQAFNSLIGFAQRNGDWLGPLALGVIGFTAAVWALNAASSAYAATQKALAAVHVKDIALWTAKTAGVIANTVATGAAAVASGVMAAAQWVVNAATTAYLAVQAMVAAVNVKDIALWTAKTAGIIASAVATGAAAVASGVMTAAQWLLNVAMYANPIGLVVLAIVALIAIIYLLWTHSAGFRSFFIGAWGEIWSWMKSIGAWFAGPFANFFISGYNLVKAGATQVLSWLHTGWSEFINFFTGMPGRISSIASGMWNGIVSAFKGMINSVIGMWNSLHFNIPKVSIPGVGSIGGGSVGVPQIPFMASGGTVTRGGMVMVGEAGPELLSLPGGASVTPLERGSGASYNITVNAGMGASGQEIGAQIVSVIKAYERNNGAGWRS